MLLSFIIIALSSITLYITPPGSVVNWSEWKFVGLTKYQWQSIHTIFTFLFVVAIGVHLYFNWKVLLTYLKTKLHEGMHRKRELMFSSALSGFILLVTIANLPPAKSVMDLGEDLANSWVSPKEEPPIPHAELLTLSNLSAKLRLKYEDIIGKLQARGITPDSSLL